MREQRKCKENKYADRSDWQRVLERGYTQTYLETKHFKGYISLIQLVKVSGPVYVSYSGNRICIADDDYLWLQQFPSDAHHAVTTIFDPSGNLIQADKLNSLIEEKTSL